MIKNPYINALVASLYITIVACVMFFGLQKFGPANSIVIPITVISLFTLSAAIMGYLFFFEPLQLYVEKQTKQAMIFFLKTIATFAGITILIVLLLLVL
jgi:hypothetical protein